MSIERLRAVREQARRDRAEQESQRIRDDELRRLDESFRLAWMHVFDARDSYPSEEFTRVTASAFVSLGAGIRDRFWDFRLIAFLEMENIPLPSRFAAEMLMYAAVGDSSMVGSYIAEGGDMFQPIVMAHFDLLSVLPTLEAQQPGLPFTPPITLVELGNLLDLTYAQIWGEKRISGPRQKWQTLDDEPGKQRKRWRSTDPDRHRILLNSCRQIRPILLRSWSD